MKLSIIIPTYNEVSTFLELLRKVESVNLEDIEKEIIIIDDFSTDGTKAIPRDVRGSTAVRSIVVSKSKTVFL